MAFSDLTPQQQEDLRQYDLYMRGVIRALLKVAKENDPLQWGAFAQMNVDPVVDTLDPAEEIPTRTGLAGARPFTAAEYKALRNLLRQLVGLLEQNRALAVKAIGINVD